MQAAAAEGSPDDAYRAPFLTLFTLDGLRNMVAPPPQPQPPPQAQPQTNVFG